MRVGQCPRFPLSPIDTAPDSGYTEFQRGDSIMKDTILSVIRLIATPVLLMVLGACATVLMGPNLDALAGML